MKKDVIIDYAIYAMLLVLLFAMVGSALILIRTMRIEWYFITAITTIIAIVVNYLTMKYDDYDDEP